MSNNVITKLAAANEGTTSPVSHFTGSAQFLLFLDAAFTGAADVKLQDSADGVTYADVVALGEAAAVVSADGRYAYPYVRPYVRLVTGAGVGTTTAKFRVNEIGNFPISQEAVPAAADVGYGDVFYRFLEQAFAE